MMELSPDDVHLGDFVLVELPNGSRLSGELTAIEDGRAIITTVDGAGNAIAELETAVDHCTLHPEGRIHDKPWTHSTGNESTPEYRSRVYDAADFIAVTLIGNLVFLLLVGALVAATYLTPTHAERIAELVVVGMIAVMGTQIVVIWKLLQDER